MVEGREGEGARRYFVADDLNLEMKLLCIEDIGDFKEVYVPQCWCGIEADVAVRAQVIAKRNFVNRWKGQGSGWCSLPAPSCPSGLCDSKINGLPCLDGITESAAFYAVSRHTVKHVIAAHATAVTFAPDTPFLEARGTRSCSDLRDTCTSNRSCDACTFCNRWHPCFPSLGTILREK